MVVVGLVGLVVLVDLVARVVLGVHLVLVLLQALGLLVVPCILGLLVVQVVLDILGVLGLLEVVVVAAQGKASQPQRNHMVGQRTRTFSCQSLKKIVKKINIYQLKREFFSSFFI